MDVKVSVKPGGNGQIKASVIPEIVIARLGNDPESKDFLYRFFTDPEIWDSLCDEDRNYAFIHDFTNSMVLGQNCCLVPYVDGNPIGMFYGYMMNGSILEVHQGLFKQYRGKIGFRAQKMCLDRAFEDTGANALMGLVEVSNKPAWFAALHSGFKIQGKIKDYYLRNGESEDVYILIRER